MAVSNQEKSPSEFLKPSDGQIDQAEDNLARCIEAYDRKGNQGLEQELNRIHPCPAGLRRVPLGGPFPDSYSQMLASPASLKPPANSSQQ